MIPAPALRLLLRLKLRGTLKRSWRKLTTLKGLLLSLLGVSLFVLWFGSVIFSSSRGSRQVIEPEDLPSVVALGLAFITLISVSSAFGFRGLYLPSQEIERLFSGPVRNRDLVRYRLWTNFGRGLFGAIFVSVLVSRRMPRPELAFAGTFLAMQTIPVLNQLLAILAGTLEERVAKRMARLRGVLVVMAVLLIGPAVFLFSTGKSLADFGGVFEGFEFEGVLQSPWVLGLCRVLAPWVYSIAATDVAGFLPWFGGALVVWIGLIEVTARLPVDFRETSLNTASTVAARLQRMKRGGGGATAAAGKVSRRTVGWPIPWLAGRGPVGAVAWRKTTAIVRKAKGTLLVATFVLGFVCLLPTIAHLDAGEGGELAAPLLVAMLGTLYLCAGLRFDFRDELDRMEVIKAWPLKPAKLFFALLLPEALLVSTLLFVAVVGRALVTGTMQPTVLAIALVLPLVVFAWIALDNAAFLISPVRFIPGQSGAMQNVGRGVIMMFARGVILAIVAALAGFPAWLIVHFRENLGLGFDQALLVAAALLGLVLLGLDLVLVRIGGWCLGRFDVARDRG